MKSWVGRLFATGTKQTDFLARYAEVFNTVEGNTTFYALPAPEVVARWREQVPDTFRFCFKFPKAITHDKLLVDCRDEVATFLARVAPLQHKLGTLFLQLPPRFGPGELLLPDRAGSRLRFSQIGIELHRLDGRRLRPRVGVTRRQHAVCRGKRVRV